MTLEQSRPHRRGWTSGTNRSPRLLLLSLPLLLLLAVPILMLVARTTPAAVLHELSSPETQDAIRLSLLTSGVALVVSMLLGAPLAYWLARSPSRSAMLVQTLVDLPTVLPPSVAGVALLLAFGRNGPLGGWLESLGVEIAFTPVAVVMAQVFVASPYFVRAARAGFASVQGEVREAALIDGASGFRLFRHVVAPLAARSIGAGAAMCWSRAVGEFGATIIFAGNMQGRTQTMPLAVYLGFEHGLDRALVLSTVLIAMSLLVLLTVRLLGWRGEGAEQ
ncbi:MAG: ABC transporter permease [Planctomycetota bacterium]|nr:ABC transporter permease [Planctomycetota bacterium]